MCVTSSPAHLASTIVFANRGTRDGKPVHVLGYQNTAKSEAAGPNAMLLPIPSAAPMGPSNMVDTRMFGGFLTDYADALRPRMRGISRGGSGMLSLSDRSSVQVFERGSYTVVLARNASADEIAAALEQVPPAKRPTIGTHLLDVYAAIYHGWHLALCCFDGRVDAEPLLWWYEPAFTTLFMPGLDAHDGKAPNLDANVTIDHSLIIGAAGGTQVVGPQKLARVVAPRGSKDADAGLFSTMITGKIDQRGALPNGDWWVDHVGYIERRLVIGAAIG